MANVYVKPVILRSTAMGTMAGTVVPLDDSTGPASGVGSTSGYLAPTTGNVYMVESRVGGKIGIIMETLAATSIGAYTHLLVGPGLTTDGAYRSGIGVAYPGAIPLTTNGLYATAAYGPFESARFGVAYSTSSDTGARYIPLAIGASTVATYTTASTEALASAASTIRMFVFEMD